MRYQVIGTCAIIRERNTSHIGRVLSIFTDFEGALHIRDKVYQKQNGAYRIPVTCLEKVNFPILKAGTTIIRCEGFSYREGCITPVGEDYADMLLALFDQLKAQKDKLDALSACLDTHRTTEHAPTLF